MIAKVWSRRKYNYQVKEPGWCTVVCVSIYLCVVFRIILLIAR